MDLIGQSIGKIAIFAGAFWALPHLMAGIARVVNKGHGAPARDFRRIGLASMLAAGVALVILFALASLFGEWPRSEGGPQSFLRSLSILLPIGLGLYAMGMYRFALAPYRTEADQVEWQKWSSSGMVSKVIFGAISIQVLAVLGALAGIRLALTLP